jgi:SinI restriction endonuclease
MPENLKVPATEGTALPAPANSYVELAREAHAKLAKGAKIGRKLYQLKHHETWSPELERIIVFCAENPSANFPSINKFQPSANTKEEIQEDRKKHEDYFLKYVKNYYWGRRPLARPTVNTKTDPALGTVLKKAFTYNDENLEPALASHRECMVSENAVGELLERYIAQKYRKRGWNWCAGETVKFADFFAPDRKPKRLVLQVKNQANSENSASSSVREDTEIIKWFRRNSKTGAEHWAERSKKRGKGTTPGFPDNDGSLNEPDFQKFVAGYRWANEEDAAEEPSDSGYNGEEGEGS